MRSRWKIVTTPFCGATSALRPYEQHCPIYNQTALSRPLGNIDLSQQFFEFLFAQSLSEFRETRMTQFMMLPFFNLSSHFNIEPGTNRYCSAL